MRLPTVHPESENVTVFVVPSSSELYAALKALPAHPQRAVGGECARVEQRPVGQDGERGHGGGVGRSVGRDRRAEAVADLHGADIGDLDRADHRPGKFLAGLAVAVIVEAELGEDVDRDLAGQVEVPADPRRDTVGGLRRGGRIDRQQREAARRMKDPPRRRGRISGTDGAAPADALMGPRCRAGRACHRCPGGAQGGRLRSDRYGRLQGQRLDGEIARQEGRQVIGAEERRDQIRQAERLGQRRVQRPDRGLGRTVIVDAHMRRDRTDDDLAVHRARIDGLAGLPVRPVRRRGVEVEDQAGDLDERLDVAGRRIGVLDERHVDEGVDLETQRIGLAARADGEVDVGKADGDAVRQTDRALRDGGDGVVECHRPGEAALEVEIAVDGDLEQPPGLAVLGLEDRGEQLERRLEADVGTRLPERIVDRPDERERVDLEGCAGGRVVEELDRLALDAAEHRRRAADSRLRLERPDEGEALHLHGREILLQRGGHQREIAVADHQRRHGLRRDRVLRIGGLDGEGVAGRVVGDHRPERQLQRLAIRSDDVDLDAEIEIRRLERQRRRRADRIEQQRAVLVHRCRSRSR
jgi:hypothetical protein